jgi:peptidoglycan hydrolase-like protein with peptidoglycan-binding domain
MTPFAARFSFLLFALLTGAMAANIFVLQPPREVASAARRPATPGTATWSASPGESTASSPSAGGALVPPLETSAVSPAIDTNRSDLTRAIQRELKAKGYEAGAVDGVAGLVTRGAIMAYESDSGLQLTGEPRAALLEHLVLGSPGSRGEDGARTSPGPEAEAVIRAVQRAFRQLGYMTTLPDGRLNEPTRRAIRKFEQDRKLKESGRISGELLAKLASLANDALYAR